MGWNRADRSTPFGRSGEGEHRPVAEAVVVGGTVHAAQAVDVPRAGGKAAALVAQARRRQVVADGVPHAVGWVPGLQLVADDG